jgi:hypothetical protein
MDQIEMLTGIVIGAVIGAYTSDEVKRCLKWVKSIVQKKL